MELKYKNWNDITVNIFNKLKTIDVNAGDDLDMLNSNIELLSILCDVDEDTIANLTTTEFTNLLLQTAFLKDMPKADINDSYVINGKEYTVFLSMKNMTVSQYIDFQTFYKEQDKYLKELLSIFLIPKGKKYGEGYDINETINDIGEYLSIVDAYSILFFFIILFQNLTKVTLTCCIKDMKKMMKKMTNKAELEKTKAAIREIQKVKDLVKNGPGFF